MVEFFLPTEFTSKMLRTIPAQRKVVHRYFSEGKLLTYTLATEKNMLWAVFSCESESELIEMIESLPMTRYFNFEYHKVMFHEMVTVFPALSLN